MFAFVKRGVFLLSLALAASPAFAGDHPFPLASCAPPDAYLLVAARHNPERDFLDQYYARVFDAVTKCGAIDEIWELITSTQDPDAVEQADAMIDKANKLLHGVEWGELFKHEFVYVGRVGFPAWEHAAIGRGPDAMIEKNFAGLKSIITEIVKLVGAPASLDESRIEGADVCQLRFGEQVPFSFYIARRKGLIMLGLGNSLRDDVLKRLAGKADTPGLVDSPRFKAAFAALPPAEDDLMFFDVTRMMEGLQSTFTMIEKLGPGGQHVKPNAPAPRKAAPKGDDDEQSDDEESDSDSGEAAPPAEAGQEVTPAQVLAPIQRLLKDFAIIDYVANTSRTEGFRVFTDEITLLRADARSRGLYPIVARTAHFERFDQFVPKEASSFSVSTGFDVVAGYDWLLSIVRDDVPQGAELLKSWDEIQKQIGVNIKDDVLGWIEGSAISVSLPGGAHGGDSVAFYAVRDEKKAHDKVNAGIVALDGMLRKHAGPQQGLMLKEIKVGGREGFHSVAHPFMLMLQMPPVAWGVADGYLIIGSNEKAIERCLAVANGKRPSIRESERFRREAIVPEGKIVSASFNDSSKWHEELKQGLSAATVSLGMMTAFTPIPDEEGGRVIRAIPSILGKLVKVADTLNFYQSESSVQTFDGKAWRMRSVENYKDPATLKKQAADEDEESDNGNGSHSKNDNADGQDEGKDSAAPPAGKKSSDED